MTNKYQLPATLVAAINSDDYNNGGADISVSQLVAPPRQVALRRKHRDEITEDVSERIWILLGKSIHKILEDAQADALAEERLFTQVQGWRVSGAFDSLTLDQDGAGWHLWDWKTCSVWKVAHEDFKDWEAQTNLYAYLLHEAGFNVTGISIGAILRDWSKSQAARGGDYPDKGVAVVPIPLWRVEHQRDYLEERVAMHQAAQAGVLPECSSEERWQKADQWAVMKAGRKSALRVLATEAEARSLLTEKDLTLQRRPGVATRCESYCTAAPFCTQYQSTKPQEDTQA